MFPIPINPIDIFTGFVSSAIGWSWNKVVQGIYTWFAEGLLILIEWVWGLLDTATTPRLTADWFQNGVVATLTPIALAVTVAMMLMTAIQAGLGGRPELIGDAIREPVRALVGTAFTAVVLDRMIRFADVISDNVWTGARPHTKAVLDGVIAVMLTEGGGLAITFLGPLLLLIGIVGMLMTTVLLFMRSALLYFVAAFAPLVWSTSVLPMMRNSVRRMVHLCVALVLAKPAIVISLAIGMQLIAATTDSFEESGSAIGAIGVLFTGFGCFLIASVSPFVIFRLLPTVEGAVATTGIAGGWGRSAMTAAQAAMMVKSLGASAAASAATRAIPAAAPAGGGFGAPSSGSGGGFAGGSQSGGAGGGIPGAGEAASAAGSGAGPSTSTTSASTTPATGGRRATTTASTRDPASSPSAGGTVSGVRRVIVRSGRRPADIETDRGE